MLALTTEVWDCILLTLFDFNVPMLYLQLQIRHVCNMVEFTNFSQQNSPRPGEWPCMRFPIFPIAALSLLLPQEEPLRLQRDCRVLRGGRRRVQAEVRLVARHLRQLFPQLIQRRHLNGKHRRLAFFIWSSVREHPDMMSSKLLDFFTPLSAFGPDL